MSEANLNRRDPAEPLSVPERFKKEASIAQEAPRVVSAGSVLAILCGVAAVLGMLTGGVTLLTIKIPELTELFYPSLPGPASALDQGQVKSDEEQINDLLQDLAREWNSTWPGGVRPSTVYAHEYQTYKLPARAKGDHLEGAPSGSITIRKFRLDGFASSEHTSSCIDATFLISRNITAAAWWEDDGPLNADARSVLAVERPVRYSFLVQKTEEGWRITSQTWLGKGSARIRAQEDTSAAELEIPDISAIPDQRPSFDQARAVVEARAYNASLGLLDERSYFSGFELTLSDETTRTTEELRGRLMKFSSSMNSVQQTSTLLGLAQIDENNAVGVVKNRLDFQPAESETRNVYSAEWTEQVTFNIGRLHAGWRIAKIKRLTASPILDHYNF